ncbi:hypothetical protein V6N12_024358 [Hibiscus sabdariffa]|uniref:Uncharacterized protein n=1 Tax=Hibiscus sabdariffa TaxID=183260 RepID=A0ABR2G0C2_9ROSI
MQAELCNTVVDAGVGRGMNFHAGIGDSEENIMFITEDHDVHLLDDDDDDVETVIAYANERNGLDVEDDVWSVAIARLGLGNEQLV